MSNKPYFDPDFENHLERINGPTCRVCIDNESMEDCTVVKVDSVKKQGLLLEVVQVLTDLNLTISKGFISSDAGWFMDVFHVKDEHGNKITDQKVINYMQQGIDTAKGTPKSAKAKAYANKIFRPEHQNGHTAIEMSGTDRPGLFSEISAALADLHCNIVEAHAWSHNDRLACVAYISEQSTDAPIDDPTRLATIEDHLTMVLQATTAPSPSGNQANQQEVKTAGFLGGSEEGTMTNVERRLHQLMLSVRDFDGPSGPPSLPAVTSTGSEESDEEGRKTMVKIESCDEKGYSIVSIDCKDRPRLMFDTVCTLTDMQYVIFHACISSGGGYAFQEYFIRHKDGRALSTESEKERVIKCLEAAIERRVCEGVRLELCADNRVGLLSDITRVLRENGLTVVRADVATQGEKAVNALYVKDISGNEVDMEFVESMKRQMVGPIVLQVRNETKGQSLPDQRSSRFSMGDMLKSQIDSFFHSFVTIK
ncbi:ACT domain-containing protein ACR2 [Alnus glutinosa]|uniref:ACT domain-containing protein ACR2 n=1 Tax=Alnus glutinosa TaxID=3517 RepID=UPI002D77ADCF|nr:ACT domain-containing protein ACR2 [Alnus glutinosa]